MKQTASILLLALLSFNWIGYRFASNFMERTAQAAFDTRIENEQYDEQHLIELRVPLNIAYLPEQSTGYERFDGEVEINGTHYKYVKRKIENGELVLLCLPNETKTRFQNSRVDFFKLVNDLDQPSQGKEKNGNSFKAFTAEYKQETNLWFIKPFLNNALQHQTAHHDIAAAGFISIPEEPPRA